MNFNCDELKEILSEALSSRSGYCREELEKMVFDPNDYYDIPDLGETAAIENIDFFDGYCDSVSFYLESKDGLMSLMIIIGDRCRNVARAREAVEAYSKSCVSKLFYVVNDITNAVDALTLECRFYVSEKSNAAPLVKQLLYMLKSREFLDDAAPMLELFDGLCVKAG